MKLDLNLVSIKNILSDKYNKYLFLLIFLISIPVFLFLFFSKDLHNYMFTYKVTVPYAQKIDEETLIGSNDIPFLTFYKFSRFIRTNEEINKSCPDFSKNVKFNQWEARNPTDWRISIKNKNTKEIEICINKIFLEIEKKRSEQISIVENLSKMEMEIFQEGVSTVMYDTKFKEFMNQMSDATENLDLYEREKTLNKKYDKNNLTDFESKSKLSEFELINLLRDINMYEDTSNIKLRQNFLTGYIFNFLASYKALKYTNNLTTTKITKVDNEYFLKKNIFKFNTAIIVLFLVIFTIINYNKFIKST